MDLPADAAARIALVAVVVAVGSVALLHVLEPEYDPSWRMLSEYALGRYGVLMRIAFVAAGTAVVALAIALDPRASFMSTKLLVLVALGPLGASVVDTDPITVSPAAMSRRSQVHAALGGLFILGFPVAATLTGLATAADPAIGPVLAVASIVPWLGLGWFLATSARHRRPDGSGGPDVPIGVPNRANMAAYLAWVALAAAVVLG